MTEPAGTRRAAPIATNPRPQPTSSTASSPRQRRMSSRRSRTRCLSHRLDAIIQQAITLIAMPVANAVGANAGTIWKKRMPTLIPISPGPPSPRLRTTVGASIP